MSAARLADEWGSGLSPPVPGPQLVVDGVRWATGMAIPAARDWRGNGRKAH